MIKLNLYVYIYNTDQTTLIGGLVSIRCLFTQTGYIGIVQLLHKQEV